MNLENLTNQRFQNVKITCIIWNKFHLKKGFDGEPLIIFCDINIYAGKAYVTEGTCMGCL